MAIVVIANDSTTTHTISQLTKLIWNFIFRLVPIARRLLEGRRSLHSGLDRLKQLVTTTIVARVGTTFAVHCLSITTTVTTATTDSDSLAIILSTGLLIVHPAAGFA